MKKRLISLFTAISFASTIMSTTLLGPKTIVQADSTETYNWSNAQIVGGGFIPGIIYNPTEPDLIYTRTDMGGAYRWNPSNNSWLPLTDWVSNEEWNLLGIESLATDPIETNRVYLAAGTYTNDWTDMNGEILRSEDKGDTWKRTQLPFKLGGNEPGRSLGERLVIDPNDNRILYLGNRGTNGLWRSTDYGETWSKVESFTAIGDYEDSLFGKMGIGWIAFDPATGIKADPQNNIEGSVTQTIYVGLIDSRNNIYRSTDGGDTWEPLSGHPTKITYTKDGQEISHSIYPIHGIYSDGNLYFPYSTGVGPYDGDKGQVWKYNIASETWTDITPIKPSKEDGTDNDAMHWGYGGLSVDSQNPDTIIVVTFNRWWPDETIYRTTDGGSTWSPIWEYDGYPNRKDRYIIDYSAAPWLDWGGGKSLPEKTPKLGWMMGDLEIDPHNSDRMMYGTGATLYGSNNLTDWDIEDGIVKIEVMAQGIEETAVLGLISPPTGAPLISVLGDIGGFRHEDLNTVPNYMTNPTLGTSTGIDYAELSPDIIVRVGYSTGGYSMGYSSDNGKTWTPTAPLENAEAGKVALSADGKTILWSPEGTAPVSYSRDNGTTWIASRGVPAKANIASDRVDSNKFYAFSGGKFYVSTDSGVNFTETEATGLPAESSVNFKAVPGIEGDIWLAGGSDKEGIYGIWHSTDSGASFTKLDNVSKADVIGFGKAAPGKTYLTLFMSGVIDGVSGIYRSIDAGDSWTRINDDQHQYGSTNYSITGDPRIYGRVYFGTNGRGIIYGDIASSTNSSLDISTATFDRLPNNQRDITANLTLNGNTLTGIKNGVRYLTYGTDYNINGSVVTISKAYLARQPIGNAIYTFEFSGGTYSELIITTRETTIVSTVLEDFENQNSTFFEVGNDQGNLPLNISNVVSSATDKVLSGSRSLKVEYQENGDGYLKIFENSHNLAAGDSIVYNVYVPTGSNVSGFSVFCMDRNWGGWTEQSYDVTRQDEWITINFKVPDNYSGVVNMIGLKIITEDGGHIYLDDITKASYGSDLIEVSNIADINLTVRQGEIYSLPTTVEATMSNGFKRNVNISWDTAADTSSLGEKIYTGTVSGYIKSVKLTLNVVASSKVAITLQDFEDQSNTYFEVGRDNGNLPLTITNVAASDTDKVLSGSRSLKVEYSGAGDGYLNIFENSDHGLIAGDSITYYVYVPGSSNINEFAVFSMDKNWGGWSEQIYRVNEQDKWLTITYTIPSSYIVPANMIGLRVKTTGAGHIYLDNIKKTGERTVIIEAVIAQINSISETVTLLDISKVKAARTAYEALTAELKALITNYSKLTEAESVIAGLTIADNGIADITASVNQGSSYSLPATVEATMNDGSKKSFAIVWDSTVDTSMVGIHEVTGSVEGYSRKIKLTLNVNAVYVPSPETPTAPAIANTTNTNTAIVVSIINSVSTNGKVTIDVTNNKLVAKEIFDAIKGTDKSVTFTQNGVEWTFNGKDINNSTKTIDTTVKVTSLESSTTANKLEIQNKVNGKDVIVISFANNGQLPGKARVRIKLDAVWLASKNKNDINIYYYNETSHALEVITTALAADSEGYVSFDITHNSDYIVTDADLTKVIVPTPEDPKQEELKTTTLVRLGGENRYETAVKVSQAGWTLSDNVVLARGDDFADALTSAPFARQLNAPILLTQTNFLDTNVEEELKRLKTKKVYVIGGIGAISTSVESAVKAMGITVERISGSDRYATSLAIANKLTNKSQVFLATGTSYADALSISSYAAAVGSPILLTSKNQMTSGATKFIKDNNSKVYVIGGTGVISETVVKGLTGAERISGADRYATNIAVLNKFAAGLDFSNIYLAAGSNYPDALCTSALAGKEKAPILLVNNNDINVQKTYIKTIKATKVIIVGGEGVLTQKTIDNLIK